MTVKEYNRSVEEYADSVYRFIRADLKDEERANNIVQETTVTDTSEVLKVVVGQELLIVENGLRGWG